MRQKNSIIHFFALAARLIIGSVFIFSGFVKGVDPMGSAIKFHDYFSAFGWDFLQALSLPLALTLSSLEFIVGISLFFGLKIRLGVWGALLFMLIFTPLTFLLAITNPVTDCGCFGDALILTNWETFFKNIVLLAFIIPLFAIRKKFPLTRVVPAEWTVLVAFLVFILGISEYSLRHLPLLDFRPYHIGASIPDGMKIPENAPRDEYKTVLIYEKNGVHKEFTTANFPWKDSSWSFVDQHSTLIKEGYKPPIHDFDLVDSNGRNFTDEILGYPGYTFLLVSPDLSDVPDVAMEKAGVLAIYCNDYSIRFYACTSSPQAEITTTKNNWGFTFPFFNTDETTLKTIIRSNPGLLLLKEGVILGKWSWRDFPGPGDLESNLLSMQITKFDRGLEGWKTAGLFFTFLLLWAVAAGIRSKSGEAKK